MGAMFPNAGNFGIPATELAYRPAGGAVRAVVPTPVSASVFWSTPPSAATVAAVIALVRPQTRRRSGGRPPAGASDSRSGPSRPARPSPVWKRAAGLLHGNGAGAQRA
jgi:hypothetical protein